MIAKNLNVTDKGLTLVEFLIALALTLMILGGAISVFVSSKESFRLEEDLSELQESFRFVADRFNQDLSMVGYAGCTTPFKNGSPTIDAFVTGINVGEFIQGSEGGTNPDSISVSFALPGSGTPVLDGVITNKADPVPVSTNQALYQALKANFDLASPKATTLLVTNCNGGNIFLATGVEETAVDLDGDGADDITAGMIKHVSGVTLDSVSNDYDELSRPYGIADEESSKVFGMEQVSYKIDTIAGVTGLYEKRGSESWQLLFDNVTDMQILYGVDSDGRGGNADQYVEWSSGLSVATITSLRVTLTLVVSTTSSGEITRDYTFFVKLRNMGLA